MIRSRTLRQSLQWQEMFRPQSMVRPMRGSRRPIRSTIRFRNLLKASRQPAQLRAGLADWCLRATRRCSCRAFAKARSSRPTWTGWRAPKSSLPAASTSPTAQAELQRLAVAHRNALAALATALEAQPDAATNRLLDRLDAERAAHDAHLAIEVVLAKRIDLRETYLGRLAKLEPERSEQKTVSDINRAGPAPQAEAALRLAQERYRDQLGPAEIAVLEEAAAQLQKLFDQIDALYKAGAMGGEADADRGPVTSVPAPERGWRGLAAIGPEHLPNCGGPASSLAMKWRTFEIDLEATSTCSMRLWRAEI